jgi:phage tail sheath protein FI
MTAGWGNVTKKWVQDNIAKVRKDCIAFVSPQRSSVVNNSGSEVTQITGDKAALAATSYSVMDSNWKYQYDRYNDVYRWVPLNGDIAGLCVNTDNIRDPWYSPAGFNRGQIRNAVKLAWNPTKANRDLLYQDGINPVINSPGNGIVLMGDKTLLAAPSAFNRINVRRLFIILEKAVATAAKYQLFEFNDSFTRSQFTSLVTPFLRSVQGRKGIYDFKVICNNSNNTGEVIDRNEFVADIFIKPAKAINFIQLNFIATRTGVAFDEIGG